ncbi:hypothetical protein NDU88_000433 [Pleurodeles waltl]|uniref:Uncharacterized protein n=1 Tax=Pleurodeles waltl TaxID=8319 RepID=A0AAV7VXC8_PLEWA|nr:hypothetical protein NDU88_000433 [Pleurodeles waltl]
MLGVTTDPAVHNRSQGVCSGRVSVSGTPAFQRCIWLAYRHAAWLWGAGATLPLDAPRSAPALPLSPTGLPAARGGAPLARRKGRVPGAGGLCA